MTQHHANGQVLSVEDIDDDEDEVFLTVWFTGDNDDSTGVKINVPAGTFNVRDNVTVTIQKAPESSEVSS